MRLLFSALFGKTTFVTRVVNYILHVCCRSTCGAECACKCCSMPRSLPVIGVRLFDDTNSWHRLLHSLFGLLAGMN